MPWQPLLLDKSQVVTVASCDPNHSYTALQKEINGGLMDKFVQNSALPIQHCDPKLVMGYFDGNTVTALWNYAQHYAISDNFCSNAARYILLTLTVSSFKIKAVTSDLSNEQLGEILAYELNTGSLWSIHHS